jgi:hypothetical protein
MLQLTPACRLLSRLSRHAKGETALRWPAPDRCGVALKQNREWGSGEVFRGIDRLLRPKTLAIIGASDSSRGGWPQSIYENLEYCGFPDPNAKLDGFLLQEMVQGLEVIVGVREDPQFGPFMLFGLGGIQVEVMRDVAIRLLPVDAETASEMVASLRGASLLGAFPWSAGARVDVLVQAMTGLSRPFIDQRGWMAEIEINPLMVLAAGHGVRAVDVRMMERKL